MYVILNLCLYASPACMANHFLMYIWYAAVQEGATQPKNLQANVDICRAAFETTQEQLISCSKVSPGTPCAVRSFVGNCLRLYTL